jgi:Glycosyl transferase family 2
MLNGQRLIVVLPAYNAGSTLRRTVDELDRELVDDVILGDDASTDPTIQTAEELGLTTVRHSINKGYGGNQKRAIGQRCRSALTSSCFPRVKPRRSRPSRPVCRSVADGPTARDGRRRGQRSLGLFSQPGDPLGRRCRPPAHGTGS